MKNVGVLFIHGMGKTEQNFSEKMRENIKRSLAPMERRKVYFEDVFYSPVLQVEQDALNQEYQDSKYPLSYDSFREGLMSSLGDAGSLLNQHNRYAYTSVQKIINEALVRLQLQIGKGGKIVIVAHSLGAEIISNYLWDAEHYNSVFDRRHRDSGYLHQTPHECITHLITMGCNIPLFNAGLPVRKCFTPPSAEFSWTNYYSRYDILGYPLSPLGDDYRKLVLDIPMNVGGLLKRYTPLCHVEYWEDRKFGRVVGEIIAEEIY